MTTVPRLRLVLTLLTLPPSDTTMTTAPRPRLVLTLLTLLLHMRRPRRDDDTQQRLSTRPSRRRQRPSPSLSLVLSHIATMTW